MQIWYNNILDDSRHVLRARGRVIRIGRDDGNDIVLASPFIAPEALVLQRKGPGWELAVLGVNGCKVDERDLQAGDRLAVGHGQTIRIFPFSLTLDAPEQDAVDHDAARLALDVALSRLIGEIHVGMLPRLDPDAGDRERRPGDEALLMMERGLEEVARSCGLFDPSRAELVDHAAALCVRGHLLEGLFAREPEPAAWRSSSHWSRLVTAVPEREAELDAAAAQVADRLELAGCAGPAERIDRVEADFWAAWSSTIDRVARELRRYLAQRHVKKQVKDIVFGYGPLEDLLRSPNVSEIMVVSRDHIYVERDGLLENSGRRFLSDAVTRSIIERIVLQVGRRIDTSRPLVDARLADGSRVNAVIPPLAVDGPCLTIRKFPGRRLRIEDLIARGSLAPAAAEFLRAAVINRRNILVSGGTGSGKTTLLNVLGDFIPDRERIVLIEDTAELRLSREHVVRLETRESNPEGAGAFTIRDLVRNALRMRPDRIVVGECRGPEALDMLQAMNTGHDGSLTTIHANGAADVILRLEVLVQMGAPLPAESIRRQIASAIDLIVQLRRDRDGVRRVCQVTELTGYDDRRGAVTAKDLFLIDGAGGELRPTGCLPTFLGELAADGLVRIDLFYR